MPAKKLLAVYVVLAAVFLGLMAHELVHVAQFGGKVYSVGIIWGAEPFGLPLPSAYVQAKPGMVADMAEFEGQAYAVQALVMFLALAVGGTMLKGS